MPDELSVLQNHIRQLIESAETTVLQSVHEGLQRDLTLGALGEGNARTVKHLHLISLLGAEIARRVGHA